MWGRGWLAEGSFGRALWLHGSARIAASWRSAAQRSAALAHHACDGIWVHAGRSGQDLQRLVLHRLNAVALHILTPGKTQMIVVSWVAAPTMDPVQSIMMHTSTPRSLNSSRARLSSTWRASSAAALEEVVPACRVGAVPPGEPGAGSGGIQREGSLSTDVEATAAL